MITWETVRLGNISSIKGGKRLPAGTSLIKNVNSHPYIRVRDLNNVSTIEITNEFEYVDDQTYKKIARYTVSEGDIILSIVGTIGLVAVVGETLDKANLTENCVKITKLAEEYNKNFIFYYLCSPRGQNEIRKGIVGAVQAKLPLKNISAIEIPMMPIDKQERIAKVLSSIDDKIELNTKINHNLEEQAKALFKSWFIDFEPFKDGEFVDSELGKIPKGWGTESFSNSIKILGGGTPKTTNDEYWNGSIPFFSPKDTSCNLYALKTEKYISEIGLENCNSRLYPVDTVFVTARGTVGKIAMAGCPMAMNQSCYALIGKSEIPQTFVYYTTCFAVNSLKKKANGAVFDAIVTRDFDAVIVVLPPLFVLNEFNSLIKPLHSKILSNQKECLLLSQLRDSLLPKLMSGEIDVSEVQV